MDDERDTTERAEENVVDVEIRKDALMRVWSTLADTKDVGEKDVTHWFRICVRELKNEDTADYLADYASGVLLAISQIECGREVLVRMNARDEMVELLRDLVDEGRALSAIPVLKRCASLLCGSRKDDVECDLEYREYVRDRPDQMIPVRSFTFGDIHLDILQEGVVLGSSADGVPSWRGVARATGRVAWPSGISLCKHIARHHNDLIRDKRVIELGSGTGLCGLVAALFGARAVVLTDLPESLEHCHANLEWNEKTHSRLHNVVSVRALQWGQFDKRDKWRADVILAAGVVVHDSQFRPLTDTIRDLLLVNPCARVVLAYQHRRAEEKAFFRMLTDVGELEWEEIESGVVCGKTVRLYSIVRRRVEK